MGRRFLAKCKECSKEFIVREGGGRDFYLLHCDTCGKEKVVYLSELDKNLPLMDGEGLSYNEKIEKYAGKCNDGNYKINAKGRCPICNSDDYGFADKNGQVTIEDYD